MHPLYKTWVSMRDRCNNPNHSNFKYYGGRGIKVCERWYDFSNFLADMGERPPGKILDRIDNDGDYEPGNVRWGTAKESIQNRRPLITKAGRSGRKGVQQHGRRWRVAINYNGKRTHLGVFDTIQTASAAYQYVTKRLHLHAEK